MPATLEMPEVETPPADKTEEKSAFAATLAAANQRASGEEIEGDDDASTATEGGTDAEPADPVDAAPVEPSEPAAPATTGPSTDWIKFAIQRNVPAGLIKMARDDDQLQDFVIEYGDPDSTDGATAVAAPAAIAFPISEEEFDATDPAHRAMKVMFDTLNTTVKAQQEELAALRGATTNLVQDRQTQAQIAFEREFDSGCDAIGMDLGAPGSPARAAAFPMFDFLVRTNPKMPKAEAARRAVFGTHPDLVTKQATTASLAALNAQQGATVGGGPSKPPALKEPTKDQTFREILAAKSRKAREAGY